jgi:hypothetical protein
MDDQQGHVIDGTARARQWRVARSPTDAATDGGEARSDAPKSIAGSLLVPADMLPSAIPADGTLEGSAHADAGEPPSGLRTDSTDRSFAKDAPQQNPFLVPEAARVEHGSRSTRRPMIAALLARSRGLISAWSRPSRPPSHLVARPRRLGERRLTRLLALAALTGAVVLTAVITTRPNVGHPSSEPALRAAGPLSSGESRALTAESNPFAQHAAARDRASHRVRRVRAHRTVGAHRRSRPASKSTVVAARYIPPVSGAASSVASPATPSYSGSSPAAATTQSAPSTAGGTTSGSVSSASSRPAFGQNGTLGPGHSPNS